MENKGKTYLVLDLKDYSVSYLQDVPAGGWTDEYKTEKMVLSYIPSGTFMMGSPNGELGIEEDETQHRVTLTKPFYIGVFQVTQRQYKLITGTNPSIHKGDTRPVDSVSYDMIRGNDSGGLWPLSAGFDRDSFLGKLKQKSRLVFDLPTEAQWEYACRAGKPTALNSGKDLSDIEQCENMNEVGRYLSNAANNTAPVGSYLPNAWGLYDMHGNIAEWCLDWYDSYNASPTTDPKGPKSSWHNGRVLRGGSLLRHACACRAASRQFYESMDDTGGDTGFRLVLNSLAEVWFEF